MIDLGVVQFGAATGLVVLVLLLATAIKGSGRDRDAVLRYSYVELVVIAASVYHQFAVVSPQTGVENIIDGATWWIMGVVILRPWLSDLVDK
ncbi:hypothetical protein [Halorarum salinum]|uniref:Uncharacterized protein n=1 Tax=Halorarum salinum TaxID=2743089 RepID=A0A7D5Q9X1_9EURY|nr:hypothetical protein [Halobaculum salinum]QLG61977.1 hypothetical protein HUG12_09690 [Halobaculum salinum]